MEPELHSFAEVAKSLSVSVSLVRGMVKAGDLATVHVGRRVLIPRAEVTRYAASLTRVTR